MLGRPRQHDYEEIRRRHEAGESYRAIARSLGMVDWRQVKRICRPRTKKKVEGDKNNP